MADYLIQGGTMQQIANAIRTKGGAAGLMNASEMANNILAIPTSAGQTQEKTVDPALTAVTVLPDDGYTLSKVTVNAMPQAEQAVPALANNNGTITSTVTQTAGYVQAGTKTGTLELDKQAATEYTPSLTDQTIPADKYLTGVQTIKAVTGTNLQALDADFVAENIKKDIDLFGIVGTYEGTGGGSNVYGTENEKVYCCIAKPDQFGQQLTFPYPEGFPNTVKNISITLAEFVEQANGIRSITSLSGGNINSFSKEMLLSGGKGGSPVQQWKETIQVTLSGTTINIVASQSYFLNNNYLVYIGA